MSVYPEMITSCYSTWCCLQEETAGRCLKWECVARTDEDTLILKIKRELGLDKLSV